MKSRFAGITILTLVLAFGGFGGFYADQLVLPSRADTVSTDDVKLKVPTSQDEKEASIASLKAIFTKLDPGASSISDTAYNAMHEALTNHWIGRMSASGDLAIKFNPMADMFAFLKLDPATGKVLDMAWVDGPQLVQAMGIPTDAGLSLLETLLTERSMQLNYIMQGHEAGADVWPYAKLPLRTPEIADVTAAAALRYLRDIEFMRAGPCYAAFRDYVARLDWKALGEEMGFPGEHFADPVIMSLSVDPSEASAGGMVADRVLGRSVIVFTIEDADNCQFVPAREIGIL